MVKWEETAAEGEYENRTQGRRPARQEHNEPSMQTDRSTLGHTMEPPNPDLLHGGLDSKTDQPLNKQRTIVDDHMSAHQLEPDQYENSVRGLLKFKLKFS